MDSGIDRIVRTTFRTTEKTDTWLGLHREDPTQDRKSKKDDSRPTDDPFTADDTSVSVNALHGFLKNLLVGAPGEPSAPVADAPPAPAPQAPPTPQAMAAARAYQTAARSSGTPHVDLTDMPPPAADPDHPPVVLSVEETRIIHRLITDLETLAARGIATLSLPAAENFLSSLQQAVAAEL